jgi:hypothetical protein
VLLQQELLLWSTEMLLQKMSKMQQLLLLPLMQLQEQRQVLAMV